MNTLQSMRVFVRVVEAGSFTAAAHTLDSRTAAMSQAISGLEARLRTRLLNRSTRRLALTPAGERYLERCLKILADVDRAEEEASGAQEHPAGALRMHSFASFGQHYVLPAVSRYRRLHPDVAVELTLSQSMPDLFKGTSDVSIITAAKLPNSDLISHQLGATFSILCASHSYVERHGSPKAPADLTNFDCLILKTPTEPAHIWTLEGPEGSVQLRVDGPVKVNIADSLAAAVCDGMGIGILPLYAAIEGLRNGTLVRVLPHHILQRTNVYALYPSRKFVDAKTKTWLEFLREQLPQMIARDAGLLEDITRAQFSREGAIPQTFISP